MVEIGRINERIDENKVKLLILLKTQLYCDWQHFPNNKLFEQKIEMRNYADYKLKNHMDF